MSPVVVRLLMAAASTRLAPAALALQEATFSATVALRASSTLSLTCPALRVNAAPPATLMLAWLTCPSVSVPTLPAKLALPLRSALASDSVPTALSALMPVSATWAPLTRLTLLSEVVPVSCSR